MNRSSIVAGAATLGVVLSACESRAPVASDGGSGGAEGANAILPWAYVLNDPVPDTAPELDPDEEELSHVRSAMATTFAASAPFPRLLAARRATWRDSSTTSSRGTVTVPGLNS